MVFFIPLQLNVFIKMSKAEKTRQFIIDKIATIFNKKGYAATSIADMTGATGLTKGSIYGNFENKDAIALAVFKHNARSLSTLLARRISLAETSYAKLNAILDFYRNNWKVFFANGGCPIINTATEADDQLPFLMIPVQNSLNEWANKVIEIIEAGKKTGEFKAAVKPEKYAQEFLILLEGGLLLAKTMNNEQYLFKALDRILRIIKEEIRH